MVIGRLTQGQPQHTTQGDKPMTKAATKDKTTKDKTTNTSNDKGGNTMTIELTSKMVDGQNAVRNLRITHDRTISLWRTVGIAAIEIDNITGKDNKLKSEYYKEVFNIGCDFQFVTIKEVTAAKRLYSDPELMDWIRSNPIKVGKTTSPVSLATKYNKDLKVKAQVTNKAAAIKEAVEKTGAVASHPKENEPTTTAADVTKVKAKIGNDDKGGDDKGGDDKGRNGDPVSTPEGSWKDLTGQLIDDIMTAHDKGEINDTDAKDIAHMLRTASDELVKSLRPASKTAESTK